MSKFAYILIGGLLAISGQVIAQEVSKDVFEVQVSQEKPLFELDKRVSRLMATSTLDVLTATKIVKDDENTKKITDKLDKIIVLLIQIKNKK